MLRCQLWTRQLALLGLLLTARTAGAEGVTTFQPGSLIMPMDITYQDEGMFQAFGLLYGLLRNNVTVYWVIDEDKEWCEANSVAVHCQFACGEAGTPACTFARATPDFTTDAVDNSDGDIGTPSPGDAISGHPYRGGPFVVASASRDAALAIIEIWNDPSLWSQPGNEWADRSVYWKVTVHEATTQFDGYVKKTLVAAPTIAVFADGNEKIASGYLRNAGIPQSNGTEFPDDKCKDLPACGPGTDYPDLLTVPAVMGDMGTYGSPDMDHRNGALFTPDRIPRYCQIMSMHWGVKDREKVVCDDDDKVPCADPDQILTYHGHEVVAEVRQFLQFPTHFFACMRSVMARVFRRTLAVSRMRAGVSN
ncbi:hypothetical protein ACFL6C_04730 [Myxococcota bacterium]